MSCRAVDGVSAKCYSQTPSAFVAPYLYRFSLLLYDWKRLLRCPMFILTRCGLHLVCCMRPTQPRAVRLFHRNKATLIKIPISPRSYASRTPSAHRSTFTGLARSGIQLLFSSTSPHLSPGKYAILDHVSLPAKSEDLFSLQKGTTHSILSAALLGGSLDTRKRFGTTPGSLRCRPPAKSPKFAGIPPILRFPISASCHGYVFVQRSNIVLPKTTSDTVNATYRLYT